MRAASISWRALLGMATILGTALTSQDVDAKVTASLVQSMDISNPAAMAFAPDGSMFYGDQYNGKIYYKASAIVDTENALGTTLFFTIANLVQGGERGLLGLAVHPEWPTKREIFAYATANPLGFSQNVIYRINGTHAVPIWAVRTNGANHRGGPIKIRKGYLWAQVGEDSNPALSQNTKNDKGKILVMNLDGSPPGAKKKLTHPLNSRHYARGFRNGFGMAWDPTNNRLWVTDNGPGCNDELNLVDLPGAKPSRVRNLGWGKKQKCRNMNAAKKKSARDTNADGVTPRIYPRRFWPKPIAITAVAFPPHDAPYLYFGNFKSPAKLRKLKLDPKTRSKPRGIEDIDLPEIAGLIGIYTIEKRESTGDLYMSVLTTTGGKIFRLEGT